MIYYYRKAGATPFKKGSEEMQEPMTESQTVRLVEWLKDNGMTDSQIVECITYINKKRE